MNQELPFYDCAEAKATPGTLMPNGETVIASRQIGYYELCDDGYRNYNRFVAVLVRPGDNYHDYVVRMISALPHGWGLGDGEYVHDLRQALRKIDVVYVAPSTSQHEPERYDAMWRPDPTPWEDAQDKLEVPDVR